MFSGILIELDSPFLRHSIVMSEPIVGAEWVVRICRPAFQDFHRILPRYYARSVLNRQLLKLRWWNPDEPFVIDVQWNAVSETDLFELLIEQEGGFPSKLRVIFFQHSLDPLVPTLWILGGLRIDEPFGEHQQLFYFSRSIIVKERAD